MKKFLDDSRPPYLPESRHVFSPSGSRYLYRLLVVACSFALLAHAQATTTANATWNGGGGSSTNWNTTANWVNNLQPDGGGTSIIHFAGSTSLTPYNDYGTYTQFNQILFDSGASSFTLTGSVIKISANGSSVGKIENNSSVLQTVSFNSNGQSIVFNGSGELDPTLGDLTVNNDIYIDNSGTINVYGNNGHTLTLNGVIHNGNSTGSLNSRDNDFVILNGNNTYTGATTIQAGTVQLGSGGTTGSLGTGTLYMASGATLGVNRSDSPTIANAINFYGSSGNANVSVATGTNATLSSAITSSGAGLAKMGSGTLFLSGANTYGGTTAINAGALIVNGNQSGATGNVSVASGGTLGGIGTIGGATTVASGGTITGATNGTVGTLNLSSALVINGTYVADLTATGNDKLAVTSTLDGTGGTLTLQGTVSSTATYVLATYTSLVAQFTTVNNPFSDHIVYYNSNGMELDLIPIPEPRTWLGGLFLCGTVGYAQRRRLQSMGIFGGCR